MCYREINEINITKFNEILQTLQWDIDVNLNDVSVSYSCFLDKFGELYNVSFLSITKRVKIYQNKQRPWISSAIVTSIKKKRISYIGCDCVRNLT